MPPMASDRRRSPPPQAAGFVLAVTLWLLAGIAIVVGLITLWSLEEVRDAARDRERVEAQLELLGTRDTLLYLASTRDITTAGLPVEALSEDERATRVLEEFGAFDRSPRGGELQLDGVPYLGLGGSSFLMQDESGLYSLVWPGDAGLDRFLGTRGIDSKKIPGLRDPLLDYIDLDDLTHLHGAEKREYEREDLPPPPNRRLLLPQEVGRVMGWRDLPRSQRDQIVELTTTYYAGAINLNTMPAELLPGWLQGCPETCDTFLAQRALRPFRSSIEVETLMGIRLPGDGAVDYRYAPSDVLRLTLWGRTGAALRIHVQLTPLADQTGPWSILAAYPVPRPALNATPKPTSSAFFADPPTDRP
jgi:hypothetical protein